MSPDQHDENSDIDGQYSSRLSTLLYFTAECILYTLHFNVAHFIVDASSEQSLIQQINAIITEQFTVILLGCII